MKTRLIIAACLLVACKKTVTQRTPVVTAIGPQKICNIADANIEITGDNFDPIVRNVLAPQEVVVPDATLSGPGDVDLVGETWVTNQTMVATVPAGTAAGVYDVNVTNPLGAKGTGAGLLEVLAPGSGSAATGVDPQFGYNGEETPITIDGTQFVVGSSVFLVAADETLTKLKRVAYVDDNTITALVPKDLAEGTYGLRIVNGDDPCPGTLANAFRVTAIPIPRVVFVTDDFFTTSTTPVQTVACGVHLNANTTTAELLPQPTGAAIPLTVSTGPTGVCPTGFEALTLSRTATLAGGQYQVRLRATADATLFSDYFVIVVVSPSANPGAIVAATPLSTPRRGAATVVARNDLGQRFVYVIGGDNPANDTEGKGNTAAANVHASVEVSAVNYDPATRVFSLAAFTQNQAALPEGRFAPSAVAVEGSDKRYLYVFGGTSSGSLALATVQRALVLPERGAPVLSDALTPAAGTLPAGAYAYMVSAVMDASDPDNPSGETLASDEATIVISEASQVTLSFAPVSGAVAYRIYRTPAPPDADAGISQRERLLTEVTAAGACSGSSCSFVDNTSAVGAQRPLAHGSLGKFVAVPVSGTGNLAVWGARADLYRTTAGGGAGYIYISGGTANGTAGLAQIVRIPVSADLSLGMSDGSQAFSNPNFFHGSTILFGVGGGAGSDRLYSLFGKVGDRYDHAAITPASGVLTSFDTAQGGSLPNVFGGGTLGIGTKAFWFGGMTGTTVQSACRDGNTSGGSAMGGDFQNFNSTGTSLATARFLPGTVRVGPFAFALGGYGASTLTSSERVEFVP